MANARAEVLNYSSSPVELTQNNSFVTDCEVQHEIKCRVLPFPKRQLASIGNVSAQAADLWLKGQRVPSTASTLNLGRAIPSIRQWIAQRSGYEPSDLSLDEIIMGLSAIASQNTADGRHARQLLVANYAIRTQSDNTIPPIVGMAWDLIDQKTRGAR